MARKSLSHQVLEEVDRARGLVSSLQDSSDPIPAILLGSVLESLHRIETMCIASQQRTVNQIMSDTGSDLVDLAERESQKPVRRRSTSHKAVTKPRKA